MGDRVAVLPNFLIIGAAKSGTTSLYRYLRDHPQVFMAQSKELKFFTSRTRWGFGPGWYARQFSDADGAVAIGEASPSYTRYPQHRGVPERIAQVLPDARLVYLIRHPIERIRSHYLHRVLQGKERAPLDQAVLKDPSYLDTSRYAMQIEQYLEWFARAQLLVITAEALRRDRLETLRRVWEFLGVDAGWRPPELEREYNRTGELRPQLLAPRPVVLTVRLAVRLGLPPRTARRLSHRPSHAVVPDEIAFSESVRQRLEAALREDVVRLHGHLGPDFDGWGIA
jgi:sulfotransferase family protein